jgi:lipopolysaccharide/colanic/teichoic acid biosynthesis glycosyltransferase
MHDIPLSHGSISRFLRSTGNGSNRTLLQQSAFRQILSREVLRSERSGNLLLLALLHFDGSHWSARPQRLTTTVSEALTSAVRSTDTIGWYAQDQSMGVLFTDLRELAKSALLESIDSKLQRAISAAVSVDSGQRPRVTYHVLPDIDCEPGPQDPVLAPECVPDPRTVAGMLKRCIDAGGSLLLLAAFLPLLALIALAIKVTSEGPVFYRQTRIGHGGRHFTLLKFRSMFRNCDDQLHRDYVTRMIAGAQVPQAHEPGAVIYKIVDDPRVTPIGKILRRSSLDELPQLLNVLKGEMSLVGPRPPLPYEFACYRDWHRRRVLEVKPGLTGLWQVYGRCRTTFEEMVRLDLRYAREWSLWLDLKILINTPMAVFQRSGAY